jgi:hypothetical protein
MSHVIEPATSGRAKCRGCGAKIAKGELRFGERLPNAFGEGEATLWFHPRCAAYKRPEPFLEALSGQPTGAAAEQPTGAASEQPIGAVPEQPTGAVPAVPDRDELRALAELGIAHRRLPRLAGADRAPTGRARCRCCRELIEKGEWRLVLEFFDEYRFEPSGFIHTGCAGEYFGTTDLLERIRYFSPDLSADELAQLADMLS